MAELALKGLEKVFESYFIKKTITYKEIYNIRNKLRDMAAEVKGSQTTTRAARHIVMIAEEAADLTHLTLMLRT